MKGQDRGPGGTPLAYTLSINSSHFAREWELGLGHSARKGCVPAGCDDGVRRGASGTSPLPVQSRWSAGEAEGTLGESPEDSERAADSVRAGGVRVPQGATWPEKGLGTGDIMGPKGRETADIPVQRKRER